MHLLVFVVVSKKYNLCCKVWLTVLVFVIYISAGSQFNCISNVLCYHYCSQYSYTCNVLHLSEYYYSEGFRIDFFSLYISVNAIEWLFSQILWFIFIARQDCVVMGLQDKTGPKISALALIDFIVSLFYLIGIQVGNHRLSLSRWQLL